MRNAVKISYLNRDYTELNRVMHLKQTRIQKPLSIHVRVTKNSYNAKDILPLCLDERKNKTKKEKKIGEL